MGKIKDYGDAVIVGGIFTNLPIPVFLKSRIIIGGPMMLVHVLLETVHNCSH
jgi:hypothetical protein